MEPTIKPRLMNNTLSAGPHTYTKQQIGTRYMVIGIRTLVDLANARDVQQSTLCRTRSR
jgi:hypothetical protein